MSKKSFLALTFAGVAVLYSACSIIDKLTEFDIPYTTTFSIPAIPVYDPALTPPLDIASPKISTGIKKIADDNATATNLFDDVTLSELTMTAKVDSSGNSSNFDFLKSVKIYVNAAGQTETLIASKDSIATGLSVLSFAASKADLIPFIKQDSLSIRMVAIQRAINPTAFKVITKMKVHVNAKNLN